MPLNAFRHPLKQREIALYFYDIEDFELDLKNLRELGRLGLLLVTHPRLDHYSFCTILPTYAFEGRRSQQ